MYNVFVYGTLCYESTVKRLINRMPTAIQAELHDYERLGGNGGLYIVRPQKGKVVKAGNGPDKDAPMPLLLMRLTDNELDRFNGYEGIGHGWYEPFNVKVKLPGFNDQEVDAIVYAAGDQATKSLAERYGA